MTDTEASPPNSGTSADAGEMFDRLGGAEFFEDFAHEFYAGVKAEPLLRAMYPEDDLAPAQRRFQLFLQQYWGGPTTYSDERGHPRLRMRHAPFAIDSAARDLWLACAERALNAAAAAHDVSDSDVATMWSYLTSAANAMINTFDEF